ncbi:MAG: putative Histidine kinase [Nitrospira sp.]|nr:MAG: putative Histidine kinase [Nitrospira sp.]
MPSSHRTRSKASRPVRSEPAAAEVLSWLSDCIDGGLCFVCKGLLIFENSQFAELVENAPPQAEGVEPALRKRLLDDAIAWNQRDLGSRKSVEYQLLAHDGRPLYYACRFNVVPYRRERGVLMVLEDVTEGVLLAQDASQVARFQSVLARIGTLGVSGVSAQELMNEAVKETAAALDVELCKILVPREPDGHLYIMAGSGLRDDLIGKLTIEGGTHSQAGYAIRERIPVVVDDLRRETRFSASKLLTEHGAVAGMCVPMLVEDRVYGVMTAHSKRVRRFTQKEQEFLCTMANTIGTVLERRRHEETQMDFYHRLFLSAQDGVMMTDTTGRIVDWNPALERMTGWTREEALGQRPVILKSGKHSPEFYERLWQSIRAGQPFVERFVNRRKDGSEFLVWESVSPVKASDGTTQYFMAILTDLSEREQMLEALRHTEQVKLVGQLAGGILHEVRNPLIGLGSLATHLAEQTSLPQEARDRCRLIAREAARIDELLESHLGQLRPRPFDIAACDLASVLDDTFTLLRPNLVKHQILIRTSLAPDLAAVDASRAHILQVCLNIVMNAIDAMPGGGPIYATLTPEFRRVPGVLMRFADGGKGITAEDLKRIYEPFFTNGKAKGVGLGLTITRDIVERHHGQLVIQSPPGQGAVVDVWLPVRHEG